MIAEHPDLVIWQVGTNAVLRRDDLGGDGELIGRGVALLKAARHRCRADGHAIRAAGARAAGLAEMEQLIAEIAERAQVGLFRRFEIMRDWERTDRLAPAAMIGPDGLHMTDRELWLSGGRPGRRACRPTGRACARRSAAPAVAGRGSRRIGAVARLRRRGRASRRGDGRATPPGDSRLAARYERTVRGLALPPRRHRLPNCRNGSMAVVTATKLLRQNAAVLFMTRRRSRPG